MRNIKLQAHKGVASECPENTMSAFRCAAAQGYDVIELDLEYTSDNKIVVLHDKTINRTARNSDGTAIERKTNINEITYQEALMYDFGISFSKKYQNEKLPLFSEVLEFAKENEIHLKVDNKIQNFPENILDIFFLQIEKYAAYISVTSNDIEFIKMCLSRVSGISVDYDGIVTEDILKKLCTIIDREHLTVWLPYECEATSWVRIPFADLESAQLVKKYSRLGIWLLTDYQYFCDMAENLNPDIVETDGTIKPIKNINCRFDMHTHSKHSHDSECEISDMASKAAERGLSGFAVTDHCDIEYYETLDLNRLVQESIADAKKNDGDIMVLHGVEMGEIFWHKEVAEEILRKNDFDVVIGSVHAVRFEGYTMPYSQIDFAKMGKVKTGEYLHQYFDDMIYMLENCDLDILAHLTCPLRYINGKYGMGMDCSPYEDKIKQILKYIIEHKIALEINTSCVYKGSGYCEFMPEQHIIEMYKDMGGYLITTGSDAHIMENSANEFDMLYDMLKKIGFKNTYYYKNRCAIPCAIV